LGQDIFEPLKGISGIGRSEGPIGGPGFVGGGLDPRPAPGNGPDPAVHSPDSPIWWGFWAKTILFNPAPFAERPKEGFRGPPILGWEPTAKKNFGRGEFPAGRDSDREGMFRPTPRGARDFFQRRFRFLFLGKKFQLKKRLELKFRFLRFFRNFGRFLGIVFFFFFFFFLVGSAFF